MMLLTALAALSISVIGVVCFALMMEWVNKKFGFVSAAFVAIFIIAPLLIALKRIFLEIGA